MSKRASFKDVFLFDDKWVFVIGIPIISILAAINYFPHFDPGVSFWLVCFPVSFSYVFIYWLVFRYLVYWLIQKFPNRSQIRKRIYIELGVVIAGIIIIANILNVIYTAIDVGLPPDGAKDITMLLFSFIVCAMIISVYEGTRFYTKLLKAEIEKEKLEKENIHAILIGLQNQVNPHFLFNSLNTLAYLIPSTADAAQNFIKDFSKVYRYILETEREAIVPLDQELEFLKSYSYLLNERFGANFKLNLDIKDEDLSCYVPPISLQILVENAVQHNVVSQDHPLEVNIWTENGNMIYVQNVIKLKTHYEIGKKIGLANIRDRYKLVSNKNIQIDKSKRNFKVGLPLLIVHEEEKVAYV
ncbi:sensor histidine kinase [Portibacter lacus]|uniref:Histidine kinase n=1 Tax=Portibacter lacus TaxID=1099794 RepID=A0AA37WHV1_9BACT|nr:histidine kinase [Portibacter lacus]GLR20024.1 histidine kinase [Portibacter lacus]